ncbi:MAG TPA: hypothetical protein VE178_12670 [Silvibacterium sp.]|nr:hypothetical protein [Silvibacterium sp.]
MSSTTVQTNLATDLQTLAADVVAKALKGGASDAEVTIRESDDSTELCMAELGRLGGMGR